MAATSIAHVIPIMHIPPVTDESIARALAQQQRDRASTGLRFTDDGRIIHAPVHESARPCGCDPGANRKCEAHR